MVPTESNLKNLTFNKESGSGPLIIHTTGVLALVIGSALFDTQSTKLSIFFKNVSKQKQKKLKTDSEMCLSNAMG